MKEENLIKAYEKYLAEQEKAESTVERYVRDVRSMYVWLGGETTAEEPWDRLSRDKVIEYKAWLSEGHAVSGVNSILSSLNGYFDFLGRNDLKIKYMRSQRRVFVDEAREMSVEEYRRLVFACESVGNERLSLIFQTVCSTGIRVSELKYITTESLAYEAATVSCKSKQRVVFLPTKLCKKLKNYCISRKIVSGPIFVSKNGNPVDRSNLWGEMKRICELACVPQAKVFPHNLRHLFARTYYSKSKDIVRLADVLGHSSVNTTRIYTMESGKVHKQQIQSLGLADF